MARSHAMDARTLVDEIVALIEQREQALAQRSEAGRGADIADLLMLRVLDEAQVELRHLRGLPDVPAERVFLALARLAAGLNGLSTPRVPARQLPAFRADDAAASFLPLVALLRASLAAVLASRALRLPLEARRFGVHVATLEGTASDDRCVLEVRSALASDELRSRFPTQVKIGTVPRMRDLVNLQLPGVALSALPVAPRHLPYAAGAVYFELATAGSELWREALSEGAFALHVAGDFPGLALSLWRLPPGT